MNILDALRDIPGNAPKAAVFNRIAKNMETLNAATIFRGALIRKGGTENVTGVQTIIIAVAFASAVYDTSSCWSGGNPNRLTVPSGVTRVRMSGQINFSNTRTGSMTLNIVKFGASSHINTLKTEGTGAPLRGIQLSTPILDVTAGDYFELSASFSASGVADTILNDTYTWFAMEIVK